MQKKLSALLLLSIILPMLFQPRQQAVANGGTFFLRIPFNLPTNYSIRINAIFDHQSPNVTNGYVTIFNGDQKVNYEPYYYDGHSGTDFNLANGYEVLAAADGVVIETKSNWNGEPPDSCGNFVKIDHQNGYKTLYCHLSGVRTNIYSGVNVKSGDPIGSSGDSGSTDQPHLHFEVYFGPLFNGFYSTDPFGWSGDYPDPLIDWPTTGQGNRAQCLWRSSPVELVSCNDVWIQDGGLGFGTNGYWNGFLGGNGSHVTTSFNISDPNYIAWWNPPNFFPGLFRLLVFIPWGNPNATLMAHYSIYTEYGWEYVTLNQTINTETWVTLGNFFCLADCFVVVDAQTGEPEWEKIVIADDMIFRQYKIFLPDVFN